MLSRLDQVLDRPSNPRAAGVARVLIGVAALLKAVQTAPLLARLDDPGLLRIPYVEWLPSVADLPMVLPVGLWMLCAALFAAGLFTTVAGAGLAVVLAAVLASDQQLYSNHLYLLLILVVLLTIGGSGSAVSLDARRGAGSTSAQTWALLLVRVQVTIVYLFAALAKVNAAFLSGTVVAVTLRREGPLAVPIDWRTFEPMVVLSVIAVLTELFLAIALWLPRWRRPAFVTGFGLHVGIAIWFVPTGQLAIFSLIILAPYLLFLDAPRRAAAVVWDDSCGFCAGWVRLFRRLDWLHAIRDVPSSEVQELEALRVPRPDADRALQLVRGGYREQGYAAVVGIAEVLPISFLWAPLLRLPPVAWIGHRVYRRVAERRKCAVSRRAEAS